MKNNVVTIFLIEFLVQQPVVINVVKGKSKFPCILLPRSQIRAPKSRRQMIELRPKRGKDYNPNYGYEPYWPDSEWVFSKHVVITTPKGSTVNITCTVVCPQYYEEYGVVCGRNINYTHKTFENYCELQKEDCTGRAKWLIAYRGKCQGDLKTFPTKRVPIITRVMEYYTNYSSRNPKTVRMWF